MVKPVKNTLKHFKRYFETHASHVRRDVLEMAAGFGDIELIYSTGINSLHNAHSVFNLASHFFPSDKVSL